MLIVLNHYSILNSSPYLLHVLDDASILEEVGSLRRVILLSLFDEALFEVFSVDAQLVPRSSASWYVLHILRQLVFVDSQLH